MSIPRVLVPQLQEGLVEIDTEATHYVCRVLRLKSGDKLIVFDGHGKHGMATIASTQKGLLVDVAGIQIDPPPKTRLTVGLATPKGERADWVVEKLTEVGVHNIVWVEFAHSVRSVQPHRSRATRWKKISESAAAQCGRNECPDFAGPVALKDFVVKRADRKIVASPGIPTATPDKRNLQSMVLLIGPEGGLAKEELETCLGNGFVTWTFSQNVLRIETAAVAAAAILLQSSPEQW